ncbi:hypothetical protein Tco_0731643 [Tanacetum coccineum]
METMNVQFDELTYMASEQLGLGPDLHGLTSGHIISGLVLNHATLTSTKPPTKNDWDFLFQPMFDEYFKPPSVVSTPISATTLLPPDVAGASSSSTFIDQELPLQVIHQTLKQQTYQSILQMLNQKKKLQSLTVTHLPIYLLLQKPAQLSHLQGL